MRVTTLGVGVLLSFVIFSVDVPKASAEVVKTLPLDFTAQVTDKLAVLAHVESQVHPATTTDAPEPVVHTVTAGETLSAIAAQYQTTWERLFAKNVNITDPDVITAGMVLTIPVIDEELPARPLPIVTIAPQVSTRARQKTTTAPTVRGSSNGNTYSRGYCTWYVKNRRPDLPNNLGNAATWVSRAAAQGMATGAAPRAGAVGQRGNHVVYVEALNGDGTITISDMNYQTVGVVTTRVVPAAQFTYIY